MDGSTVVATVLPGNEIKVPNVVPAGTSMLKDSTVIFKIAGIKNQNSAKDAGDFMITTYNKFDNE